ncbi:mitochondrial carrier domain-containing protein [Fusarium oxysporum f. sp. albedinis]|nr:mitochondrial carrier domain-containing protein [Fusarium oxysporum f. sp. albedinis]
MNQLQTNEHRPLATVPDVKSKHHEKQINYPRWFGGSASCMAVVFSHPFDLIKVRMQALSAGPKKSFPRVGFGILKSEGPKGLYRGLSAGFSRSLTYGTTRIALYEEMKQKLAKQGIPQNTPTLIMMAFLSGFIGAMVGTPSDIANIRMQNDKSLPVHLRRNYHHVVDAWAQMYRQEGWRAFTQGLWPNCFRCAVMTSSQLAMYDSFKGLLAHMAGLRREAPAVHFSASVLASLVATTLCSPMDVIRTRLMNSRQKGSLWTTLGDLVRADGYRWVFRGWTPSFIRLGPQTIATLVFLEQHKRIYRELQGYPEL